MNKDVSELSLDELVDYIKATQDRSWDVIDRIAELWNGSTEDSPVYNEKYIKQLKKQARYSKNPMELKRLNQEIMKLQKELKKNKLFS